MWNPVTGRWVDESLNATTVVDDTGTTTTTDTTDTTDTDTTTTQVSNPLILTQEDINALLDEINAGTTSVGEVATKYGLTAGEVQDEVDRLNLANVQAVQTDHGSCPALRGIPGTDDLPGFQMAMCQ